MDYFLAALIVFAAAFLGAYAGVQIATERVDDTEVRLMDIHNDQMNVMENAIIEGLEDTEDDMPEEEDEIEKKKKEESRGFFS